MKDKRIGIFGGTFDPPHFGHLIVAEQIREELKLDEVHFVPCNRPPHKDRADLTDAGHRYAMVVAATLQNAAFVPSPVEVNRPGRSYAIDTVRLLLDELGDATKLFFIAGLDSFLEIQSWKDSEELLGLCDLIVASRPGSDFRELESRLPESARGRVLEHSPDVPGFPGDEKEGKYIYLSDTLFVDISSTDIRARIEEGRSIRYRVPSEVKRYITTHGLYVAGAGEAAS